MKKLSSIIVLVFLFSCKNESKNKPQSTDKDTQNLTHISAEINTKIDAANKDSNNKELQLNLIQTLDSAALYKEALQQIDRLIDKENTNQDYWLMRGRINNKMGDTVAAIKSFVAATKIYPSPIAMLELANAFAETKNINTLTVCNDLKRMNPDGKEDAAANFFIGKYYGNVNNIKKAYLYLDSSISQDFHLVEAFIEKGYLQYHEKKYNEALKTFQNLNMVNQKNADGYYWQAKCYEALNKKDLAIENYNKALKFDASIKEAQNALLRLK